jgi:hypothetical protein
MQSRACMVLGYLNTGSWFLTPTIVWMFVRVFLCCPVKLKPCAGLNLDSMLSATFLGKNLAEFYNRNVT